MEDLIEARKLQNILSNKSEFCNWIKRNIEKNNLIEGQDFWVQKEVLELSKKGKGRKINYFLTHEATKKIILESSKNKIAKEMKEKLEKGDDLNNVLRKMCKKKEANMKVIKLDDEEYPKQLKQIKNPPEKLYVKGNILNLKKYGIAIIGKRNCSDYGRRICRIFTNNLVGYNLNIISGLAKGTDGCAHKACLEVKGKTIAVLPSGFNNIYPKENEALLNRILESGGTVITEYPPDFEKTSESCRERNRIISGLAIATLVIEAGEHSGTSITSRLTREQGKKVFCIPSSLFNSKGRGTNQMIKENKAQLVTEAEDIIKEYPELKLERRTDFDFVKLEEKKKTKGKSKNQKQNFEITEENQEIYNFLTKEPKAIDEITQGLNKPISEVTYKLSLLELEGAIEELSGKRFKLK